MTKILVIGESCLDEYIYGTCNRVCPEAAALCFCRGNKPISTSLGMAGNVLNNFKAIDNSLDYCLVTNDLSANPIIKRRFIDTKYNTIVFREDINDYTSPINIQEHNFSEYSIIVISDYNKGFLSTEDYVTIRTSAPRATIFADTKKNINQNIVDNVDFLKINSYEYAQNVLDIHSLSHLCTLIVTHGRDGCWLYHRDEKKHFATKPIDIRDVSGAGDTFLAALVIRYSYSKDIALSINFANEQAGIVVQKLGVATP